MNSRQQPPQPEGFPRARDWPDRASQLRYDVRLHLPRDIIIPGAAEVNNGSTDKT